MHSAPLSLRALLPDARLVGAADVCIERCAADLRQAEPGTLFAALPGTGRDPQSDAARAASAGCAAILSGQALPDCDVPVCIAADVRGAYARLCQALAGHPARRMKTIAVAGPNGKTTTSCLIASILTTAGCPVGIVGALGCCDGRHIGHAAQATPPADQLALWLNRMVVNGCTHAVLEATPQGLAHKHLAGIDFDAVCLTGHGTAAKGGRRDGATALLQQLSGEGFAVLNADDPAAADCLQRLHGPALTVGMHAAAEISGTLIERLVSEQTFLLTAGSETIPVRTRMIGTHHVYHCLAAAAVGLAYGIDLATVVRGLEAVDHVPGRLQRIECGQPFGVFVDFARNGEALAAALGALREVVAGRLICVAHGGGERAGQRQDKIARALYAGADVLVLSGEGFAEATAAARGELLGALPSQPEVEVAPDRRAAIAWALAHARAGDCVLICGPGPAACGMPEERAAECDDSHLARQWLYEHQSDSVHA